jgi:hypothetical protein
MNLTGGDPMPLTHNELAASLAAHLRSRQCNDRLTWENLEFSNWSVPQQGYQCRPDVFSIRRTLDPRRCQPWTCEVKASRADLFSDIRSGKWRKYAKFSCRVFFAFPSDLAYSSEIPDDAGIFEYNVIFDKAEWRLRRPARFCRGWQLTERDLMKLILGRWGTYAL